MSIKHRAAAAAALLAAATLILSGCSTDAPTPPVSTGEAGTPSGTLTVTWPATEGAGIQAAATAYMVQNPDADIQVSIADTVQYQANLRTQLSSGTAADFLFIYGGGNAGAVSVIAPGGFLAPLNDRPWMDEYTGAIKDLVTIDGNTYVLGLAATTFGPFYNEAALAAAGLTAPEVWADVIPFCEAARAAGKIPYAVGAVNPSAASAMLYALYPDLVYATDKDYQKKLDDGDTTLATNKGWQTVYKYYQEMYDAKCFSDDASGLSQDLANQQQASGDAIGQFTYGGRLAAIRALNPSTEYRLHPLSSTNKSQDDLLLPVGIGGGAAINAKAKNLQLAQAFMDYLATPEGARVYNGAQPGTIPVLTQGFTPSTVTEQIMVDKLESDKALLFINQRWPNPVMEQVNNSGLQGVLAGTKTADQVLDEVQAAYDQG